ncbi:uncharacterized protein A1O9_13103 [Exophiala aquamarina CBS 119918]|uniref:BZIP domain-containing protein n=1 Tax=Exophiala aquamarina CBS 119918 TaxID=1182545 RepID=A0A072NU10_9EURO|nr:uncharacterized protein A1O9_13103 [Exophiala aquamarina CBS 119918]KEF50847.1 hypothetical protein A1O9_13103 [Exophiala aquamarina CBS 119918]
MADPPPVTTPTASAVKPIAPRQPSLCMKPAQSPSGASPPSAPQPSLSLTSREWVIPTRPKPGRKPATDTPPTKRRDQIRASQRAFGERRAARVGDLETRIEQLEEKHKWENGMLRKTVANLEKEVEQYRADAVTCADRRGRLESELSAIKAGPKRKPISNFNSPDKVHDTALNDRTVGCGNCTLEARCQCIDDAFTAGGGEAAMTSHWHEKRTHSPVHIYGEKKIKPQPKENIEVDSTEVDISKSFPSLTRQDRRLPTSAVTDSHGFCSGGPPYIYAEIAVEQEQAESASPSLQPPVPIIDPPKQLDQITPPPSEDDLSISIPPTIPPWRCASGPGTYSPCRADPNSALSCNSPAASHAQSAAASGCCSGQAPGDSCCHSQTPSRTDSVPLPGGADAYTTAGLFVGRSVMTGTQIPTDTELEGVTGPPGLGGDSRSKVLVERGVKACETGERRILEPTTQRVAWGATTDNQHGDDSRVPEFPTNGAVVGLTGSAIPGTVSASEKETGSDERSHHPAAHVLKRTARSDDLGVSRKRRKHFHPDVKTNNLGAPLMVDGIASMSAKTDPIGQEPSTVGWTPPLPSERRSLRSQTRAAAMEKSRRLSGEDPNDGLPLAITRRRNQPKEHLGSLEHVAMPVIHNLGASNEQSDRPHPLPKRVNGTRHLRPHHGKAQSGWTDDDEERALEKLRERGVKIETDSESDESFGDDDAPRQAPPLVTDRLHRVLESRHPFDVDPSLDLRNPENRYQAIGKIAPWKRNRPTKKQLVNNLLLYQCRDNKLKFGNPHYNVMRKGGEVPVVAIIEKDDILNTPDEYPGQEPKKQHVPMTFREFIGMPKQATIARGKRKGELVFVERPNDRGRSSLGVSRTRRYRDDEVFPFVNG